MDRDAITIRLSTDEALTLAPTILRCQEMLATLEQSDRRDEDMHILAIVAMKMLPQIQGLLAIERRLVRDGLN